VGGGVLGRYDLLGGRELLRRDRALASGKGREVEKKGGRGAGNRTWPGSCQASV